MCFCGSSSGDGCGGDMISTPWAYIKNHGLVTGAQNNATAGPQADPFGSAGLCSSFSLPHCHHHGPQGLDPYPAEDAPGCPKATSPQCPTACDAGARAPHANFTADKWAFTGGAQSYAGELAIQQAVMGYGPVEVAFTVYADFESYASGIYSYDGTSEDLGGHAVKIVGWGIDAGTKYWKIANSWNPYWGEYARSHTRSHARSHQ